MRCLTYQNDGRHLKRNFAEVKSQEDDGDDTVVKELRHGDPGLYYPL
jgi:hypothetical protein